MALLIRHRWLAVILLFCMTHPQEVRAQDNLQLAEQEIKAGLLYNFLKYTSWPASDNTPMAVCLFGDDPFGGYLQPMATRTVNQRAITIRFIADTVGATQCDLLFVHAGAKNQWPKLREALGGKNVLTVSDYAGFADAGGMIEFTHKDNHISVNLNMDAVSHSGLRVQDRLLRLVTVVHPQGGTP